MLEILSFYTFILCIWSSYSHVSTNIFLWHSMVDFSYLYPTLTRKGKCFWHCWIPFLVFFISKKLKTERKSSNSAEHSSGRSASRFRASRFIWLGWRGWTQPCFSQRSHPVFQPTKCVNSRSDAMGLKISGVNHYAANSLRSSVLSSLLGQLRKLVFRRGPFQADGVHCDRRLLVLGTLQMLLHKFGCDADDMLTLPVLHHVEGL